MVRHVFLTILLAASLSGCARFAESNFNPLNWFGPSQQVDRGTEELRALVPEGALAPPADTRPLVAQITALTIDPTPQGAIVRATGLVPTQGYYNAQLVPVGQSGGTLVLAFRAEAPTGFEGTGTQASRTITAAFTLTPAELAGVRIVRVEAQGNAREVRR